MRRAVVLGCLWLVALPAAAQATFTWLAPVPLSDPGADASEPAIAMGRDGTLIALWSRGGELQATVRPPGGPFGAPVHVAGGPPLTDSPDVAIDAKGDAVAVWYQSDASTSAVFAAFRPAGGAFSDGKQISPQGLIAQNPRVVVTPSGDAVAIWQEGDGVSPSHLGAAFRPAGGDFGEPKPLGGDYAGSSGLDVALDRAGNALAVFSSNVTGSSMVESAFAPPGGPFGDVKPVAGPVEHAASPDVAVDDAGNAIAAFVLYDATITDTTKYRAFTAFRPVGGTFQTPLPLSANNRVTEVPQAAFDPQGEAIVTFMQGFKPWAAVRPPGGPFGDPVQLSPDAHDAYNPALAVDGTGRAEIVWLGDSGTGDKWRAVTRPAGGAFSEMQTLSDALGGRRFSQRVVADADGNAAAIWTRTDGTNYRAEVVGYDGAPPHITQLGVPASASAGATVPFAASVFDVWSPFTAGWDFGDGGAAPGAQASHVFAAPGKFTATLAATDELGNATSASAPITVADTTAPLLSGLALAPTRFRAAPSGASVATRVGATLRFSLSEPGSVTFRAQRATKGRRVNGRCRRATAKNRRRRVCTRFVAVRGSFTTSGVAGANTLRFRGRVGGRRLRPGRYRLVAVARDAAGNASAPARTPFRIVRR